MPGFLEKVSKAGGKKMLLTFRFNLPHPTKLEGGIRQASCLEVAQAPA